MPVNPIATTTSFVQKGHCNSPLCISSVVLKMLYFHFLWVSPLLQNDSVCNIHIQYYSCIQSVFGSGLLPPLAGLPVYVMAVNEPIMRPSSEEVLLCEPQSEAGLQLEHYNSYHNQREKHGWQLSASSDPQPQYIVPTTGKCQGKDDIVNDLSFYSRGSSMGLLQIHHSVVSQ